MVGLIPGSGSFLNLERSHDTPKVYTPWQSWVRIQIDCEPHSTLNSLNLVVESNQ